MEIGIEIAKSQPSHLYPVEPNPLPRLRSLHQNAAPPSWTEHKGTSLGWKALARAKPDKYLHSIYSTIILYTVYVYIYLHIQLHQEYIYIFTSYVCDCLKKRRPTYWSRSVRPSRNRSISSSDFRSAKAQINGIIIVKDKKYPTCMVTPKCSSICSTADRTPNQQLCFWWVRLGLGTGKLGIKCSAKAEAEDARRFCCPDTWRLSESFPPRMAVKIVNLTATAVIIAIPTPWPFYLFHHILTLILGNINSSAMRKHPMCNDQLCKTLVLS